MTEIKKISGYAAKYGKISKTLIDPKGRFKETIMHGAFDKALKSNNLDCIFVYNHSDEALASTKDGTLKLFSDEIGLRYEVDVIGSKLEAIYLKLVKNKYSKSSFKMILDPKKITLKVIKGLEHRYINEIDEVKDVSLVDSPAYTNTSSIALKCGKNSCVRVTEQRSFDNSIIQDQEKHQRQQVINSLK